MHCAKHGLFRDGIIAHHAKRIRRRVRANHFVMLVNYDGCQRQHGKQRVGGIIQCVVIGIMLIIVVAVRQRTPRILLRLLCSRHHSPFMNAR